MKPSITEHFVEIVQQPTPAAKANFGFGYPLMMESPNPFQFLITPEETIMLNFDREVRHIHTDGRTHPAAEDLWPTPWGDSIGHWEGETLVIETIAVERPGIFFMPFPLISEDARHIERLTMTEGNRIELEFTIVDPETLTEPWVFDLAYVRQPNLDRMFHSVFDNDRTIISEDRYTIAPGAL